MRPLAILLVLSSLGCRTDRGRLDLARRHEMMEADARRKDAILDLSASPRWDAPENYLDRGATPGGSGKMPFHLPALSW